MKGLDTNVLVRLLTADDEAQVEGARAFLERSRAHSPFWINRIVLCEVVRVMTSAFRLNREQLAEVVGGLLRADDLVLEDHPVVRSALYLFRISRADFADCLIATSNGFSGCARTATFDRRAAELDEFELVGQ